MILAIKGVVQSQNNHTKVNYLVSPSHMITIKLMWEVLGVCLGLNYPLTLKNWYRYTLKDISLISYMYIIFFFNFSRYIRLNFFWTNEYLLLNSVNQLNFKSNKYEKSLKIPDNRECEVKNWINFSLEDLVLPYIQFNILNMFP